MDILFVSAIAVHLLFVVVFPDYLEIQTKNIKFYQKKPPDERAEAGLPTAYKLACGEVLSVKLWVIAQSGYTCIELNQATGFAGGFDYSAFLLAFIRADKNVEHLHRDAVTIVEAVGHEKMRFCCGNNCFSRQSQGQTVGIAAKKVR